LKTSAEYSFVELPAGLRHYFFLSKNSKLFIDGGYSLNFSIDSAVDHNTSNLEISKASNLFLGFGFSYSRFSLEARCNFSRNVLGDYVYYEGNYKSVEILAGYKFL